MRKIPFAGIELTSQRVRGLRGTSELPGRPARYKYEGSDFSLNTVQFIICFLAYDIRSGQSFTYLGDTVTEMPNLSNEIDRRIRPGWMGFKRYKRELYDQPKASLLPLKARMVRSEVVEALLYGCVTWTP